MEKSNLIALVIIVVTVSLLLIISKQNPNKQYEVSKDIRLLPSWTKYMGFSIIFISLFIHILSFPYFLQVLKPFCQVSGAIGCLIVGLSREKNEDEMIMAIRLNSIFKAFFGGIIMHILWLAAEMLCGGDFNSFNSLYVTNYILGLYIFFFYKSKRSMKVKN